MERKDSLWKRYSGTEGRKKRRNKEMIDFMILLTNGT